MKPEVIFATGQGVPPGVMVTPDHFNSTFIVKVRSLQSVTPDEIKRVLQTRFEVTDCVQDFRQIVARETRRMDW